LVANNFDPRWTAQVNGASAPLLRADHAFQAVLLDRAGSFSAVLTFSAPLIWQLHLLSGLGLALMFAGVLARQRPGLLPLPEPPALAAALPDAEPVRCALPHLALAGLAAAAFWALGFALFILRRHPADDALRYALCTIPLLGLAVALWTRSLLKRL
jgi:hypothetical protein